MAAVLELQRQLQDHGQQLAQLSQQLQNMESLLRSHEEPLQTSFKTPRQGRSPIASPERKEGAPSCTTEMEIAQARWEALVNMIELEEQSRTRDVAELKKMIEQCKREKSNEAPPRSVDRGVESRLADLRCEFEGFAKQIEERLVMQEEVIKGLASRSYCKEFENHKATNGAPATALGERVTKLDLGMDQTEVLKSPAANPVAVPVDTEGCRLSQTLTHAQSQDALSESAKRRTNSSSPISRNAYARLGCGKPQPTNVMQDTMTQKKTQFTAPVAHAMHAAPVASVAAMPCITREGTAGSLMDKFERSVPEPPRIMTASRLTPPMTYRSVKTPMKAPMLQKQDFTGFVVPSPPAPHVRFASPAPFSRPLKESELLFGAPRAPPHKIRNL